MSYYKISSNEDPFLRFLKIKAASLRIDAGYNGSWDDGGADELEAQIDVYECALRTDAPKLWEEHYKEFIRVSNPEYAEYLRLKNKFEEK